jgi:hypothetical protein
VIHDGMQDLSLLAAAIAMGASLVRVMGHEPPTPAEAQEILGIR